MDNLYPTEHDDLHDLHEHDLYPTDRSGGQFQYSSLVHYNNNGGNSMHNSAQQHHQQNSHGGVIKRSNQLGGVSQQTRHARRIYGKRINHHYTTPQLNQSHPVPQSAHLCFLSSHFVMSTLLDLLLITLPFLSTPSPLTLPLHIITTYNSSPHHHHLPLLDHQWVTSYLVMRMKNY